MFKGLIGSIAGGNSAYAVGRSVLADGVHNGTDDVCGNEEPDHRAEGLEDEVHDGQLTERYDAHIVEAVERI